MVRITISPSKPKRGGGRSRQIPSGNFVSSGIEFDKAGNIVRTLTPQGQQLAQRVRGEVARRGGDVSGFQALGSLPARQEALRVRAVSARLQRQKAERQAKEQSLIDKRKKIRATGRPPLVVDVAPKPSVIQRLERERIRGFKDTKKKVKESKAFKKSVKVFDFISGGVVTESRIDKKQEKINQDIEKFNKEFGGKELDEKTFKKASTISDNLDKRIKSIEKEKKEFVKSTKGKISKFLGRESRIISEAEGKKRIKQLPKLEKDLKKLDSSLSKSKGSGKLAKANRFRLKELIKSKKQEIADVKSGKPLSILKGSLPIIPATNIPSGVTTIKFLGAQKRAKGGKIITDIIFKTSDGRIGVAKGVSLTKGKDTATIVLGRSGKKVFNLPSGKRSFRNLQTFVGRDISKAASRTFKEKRVFDNLKRVRKTKKNIIVKKNIDGILQVVRGQVAGAKGKKLLKPVLKIPGGLKVTKAKGFSLDDFASVSAVLSKKDLSLIVGKTLTVKGSKARFIGLIKGTTKVDKGGRVGGQVLSTLEKQQFSQALRKVASITASSVKQAKKSGAKTKAQLLAATILATKTSVAQKSRTTVSKAAITKVKARTRIIRTTVQPQIVKRKSRAATRGASATRVKSKAAQRTTTAQKSAQKSAVAQKTALRIKSSQRLALRKALALRTSRGAIIIPRVAVPRLLLLVSPKIKTTKRPVIRIKQVRGGFNVFAKPVKGKRLVKVNKVPLRKSDARDLRNFIIDTSLSRTGRIKSTKRKAKKRSIKVPRGFAKKTQKKFRKFRIVKGKRVPLAKGKVIERKTRLLDTRQEVKGITLRRRIKQLSRPKPKKRKRSTKRKRKR